MTAAGVVSVWIKMARVARPLSFFLNREFLRIACIALWFNCTYKIVMRAALKIFVMDFRCLQYQSKLLQHQVGYRNIKDIKRQGKFSFIIFYNLSFKNVHVPVLQCVINIACMFYYSRVLEDQLMRLKVYVILQYIGTQIKVQKST